MLKGIFLVPVAVVFYALCLFFLISLGDYERHPTYTHFFFYLKLIGLVWAINLVDAYWGAVKRIRSGDAGKPGGPPIPSPR